MLKNIVKSLTVIILSVISTISYSKESAPPRTHIKSLSKLSPSIAIQDGAVVNSIPPWIAAIYESGVDNPSCTAAFINNSWLLTARHCVEHIYPPPQLLSVAYTGLKVNNSFVKVPIDRSIFYNNASDGFVDFALLHLTTPYPYKIIGAKLYHGYKYTEYGDKPAAINYGYGRLDINTKNVNSILKSLSGRVFYFNEYVNILETGSTNGENLGGDSGGPVLINLPNINPNIFKMVSVLSIIDAKYEEYSQSALLSSNLLEFIAKVTKFSIFKYPLDGVFVPFESNSTITLSGWGGVPSRINIFALDEKKIVATCTSNDFSTSQNNNQWKCTAKFDTSSISGENYAAKIVPKEPGGFADEVYFKASIPPSIKILHPPEGYHYYQVVGKSYLVSGTGVPNTRLSYNLVENQRNILSDQALCTNSDAFTVDIHGVWNCKIKLTESTEKHYTIEVKEPDISDEPPAKRARSSNVLASRSYTVKPFEDPPTVEFVDPKNGSLITDDKVFFKMNVSHDNFRAVISVSSNNWQTTLNITNDDIAYSENSNTLVGLDKQVLVKAVARLYGAGDNQNIISESTVQFYVRRYNISILYPQYRNHIEYNQAVTIKGTATKKMQITISLEYLGEIGKNIKATSKLDAICFTHSNGDGEWKCTIDHLKATPGLYDLIADVFDPDDGENKVATAVEIFIDPNNQVHILEPHNIF